MAAFEWTLYKGLRAHLSPVPLSHWNLEGGLAMASPREFGQNTQIEYKMADSPSILLIKTENHILLRSHKWIHVYFARHTCSPIVSLHRPPTPWNGKYKYDVTQRCNLYSLILSDLFVTYMTASEQGCIILCVALAHEQPIVALDNLEYCVGFQGLWYCNAW
jgi:hypothetical protein